MPLYNVTHLGQVFTPPSLVLKLTALIENRHSEARILEPSCGDGAFLRVLPHATGVEFDPKHCPPGALQGDFFELSKTDALLTAYDTIIGNPPFVRFRDIPEETKQRLPIERFDRRTNLYVFFIDRCLDLLAPNGELIFVTPREFLKATHARHLNARLYHEGSFTHMEDLGDAPLFPGFAPNCVVFRWQKNRQNKTLHDGRLMRFDNGLLSFLSPQHQQGKKLGDLFNVRVGGVSGLDQIFECAPDIPGAVPFAYSKTRDSGAPRWMLWADDAAAPPAALLPHKQALMSRKARTFGDSNWWHWIRKPPIFLSKPAILVNVKTRRDEPFYVYQNAWVEGTLFVLYPTDTSVDAHVWAKKLNALDWNALGFRAGKRFLFGQRTLSQTRLPLDF